MSSCRIWVVEVAYVSDAKDSITVYHDGAVLSRTRTRSIDEGCAFKGRANPHQEVGRGVRRTRRCLCRVQELLLASVYS